MSSNLKVQRICQNCGLEFIAKTTFTIYCSHRCNRLAYKIKERAAKLEGSNKETQRLKLIPFEELNMKPFLSINEAAKLLGISRRTIYRMIDRKELNPGKAGARTILRRIDLETIFKKVKSENADTSNPALPKTYQFEDCYNLNEIIGKYGISYAALRNLVNRNNIPKIMDGRFLLLPKEMIDKILVSGQ